MLASRSSKFSGGGRSPPPINPNNRAIVRPEILNRAETAVRNGEKLVVSDPTAPFHRSWVVRNEKPRGILSENPQGHVGIDHQSGQLQGARIVGSTLEDGEPRRSTDRARFSIEDPDRPGVALLVAQDLVGLGIDRWNEDTVQDTIATGANVELVG